MRAYNIKRQMEEKDPIKGHAEELKALNEAAKERNAKLGRKVPHIEPRRKK